MKNSHCSFCGTYFDNQKSFPRTCLKCNNITYVNPLPVVVSVIPVFDYMVGALLIQRANDPGKGQWAFPGGYVNGGESWTAAAVREIKEEIGLDVPASKVVLLDVLMATNGNLLIFNFINQIISLDKIHFSPNEEVSAIKVAIEEEELAFPSHTKMLERFFKMNYGGY
jgi:8-oxo-dGTP pyrophosphatase MutT (NUDIX family)